MKRVLLKTISIIMVVVLTCSIQIITQSNKIEANVYSGKCGSNTEWSFDDATRTLTISGTGSVTSTPWSERVKNGYFHVEKAVVGEGVTELTSGSFGYCSDLKNVVLPSTLEVIWDNCFFDCSSLERVVIPKKVNRIEYACFRKCSSLKEIVIDSNSNYFTEIDGVVYSKDLTKLCFYPASNTNKRIIIPDGVESINSMAFENCNIEYVRIPNSVTKLEGDSFQECSNLKSFGPVGSGCDIEVGWNDTIPDCAFLGLGSLKTATIPDGVKKIGFEAFNDCENLEKVILPESLEENEGYAFCYDDYLHSTKLKTVGPFNSGSNIEYKWRKKIPNEIFRNTNTIEKITISNDIEEIGELAFAQCESLKSIDFGENVSALGYGCFALCKSLTQCSVPNSVNTMQESVFSECINLVSLKLPERLDDGTGSQFFDIVRGCKKIENLTVPEGVYSLSDFEGCESLKELHLGSDLKHMGSYDTFEDCKELKDIYFAGTEEEWEDLLVYYKGAETGGENKEMRVGDTPNYLPGVTIHFGATQDTSNVHSDFATIYNNSRKDFSGRDGFYYKDSYFDKNASEYQQSLATMSLSLAFSTYERSDYKDYSNNVVSVLKKCGYKNLETNKYGYHKKPSYDSIGCVIGRKTINDTTVIAVAVRSGGYEAEWSSNFELGASANHKGFSDSANKVYSYIDDYISDIEGKKKIWITGFSRGAAVATHTAAKLNEESGLGKNNIYAYGFATPAGVIDSKNPHSSSYNNIFNVIEYNDPITLVAPQKWGFDRYGVTKILPYRESNNEKSFSKYRNRLKEKMGDDYRVDNFKNYVYTGNLAYGTSSMINPLNHDSLGTYNRKLINSISGLIGGRSTYVDKYQSSIQSEITRLLTKDYNSINFGSLIGLVADLVPKYAVLHPHLSVTLLHNTDYLADVHANPSYYVYWMQMMDDNYSNNLHLQWGNYNCRAFKVNCPVDVYVYDLNNNEVASIEDDVPYYDEEDGIIASIDENDQKVLYLPIDEKYKIEVSAREDCDVTCGFEEYNAEYGEKSRLINFKTTELNENDEIKSTVSAFSADEIEKGALSGSSVDYGMTKDGEEIDIQSDIKGPENVTDHSYEVAVQYDESKGAVYGGGTISEGSFVKLEAENKPGYDFEGFYIDGEKIENIGSEYDKYSVRFKVTNNTTVVARFEECKHDWDDGVITIQPTYSSTGVRTYTCNICGTTTNSIVPQLESQQNTTRVVNVVNKKPTSILKIKTKKHSLKITWKKINYVSGYQINYSRKKKFSNSKTITIKDVNIGSKTIKKLKRKKRYYFRMRTFITRKRINYYSVWSKTKSKKTK